MADTSYQYSISGDFPNARVDSGSLNSEVVASSIASASVLYVITDGDDCDIWFDDPLSVPDQTTLDGVVAAHQGDPAYPGEGTTPIATDPPVAVLVEGDYWYNSTDTLFKYFDGLAIVPFQQKYWSRDGSGSVYPTTTTDDIAVGGATPNGRWHAGGELVLGGATMAGSERFRVIGESYLDSRVGINVDPSTQGSSLLRVLSTSDTTSEECYSGRIEKLGSGTLAAFAGFSASAEVDAGTVSSLAFFEAQTPIGSGTIAKAYGLFINDMDGLPVTEPFGIYQDGTADQNIFRGDVAVGAVAMSADEKLRVVGAVRIEKTDAVAAPGIYVQAATSHPVAQQAVLIDVDVNSIAIDIDSEATGKALINLQQINGNSRGDIAFGVVRTTDPSAPSEGDFWYQSTVGEFRFRKSATTVDVRDAIKLQSYAVATTAPTDEYVLAWNNAASQWEPRAMNSLPGPDYTQVTSVTSATSTSTTNVLMTGMSITPVAGQYTVFFSTTLKHSNNGQTIWLSIYAGGVQEVYSEHSIQSPRWVNAGYSGYTQAIVTVDGTQAIELRWRTSSGTATALNRSIMIVRVS